MSARTLPPGFYPATGPILAPSPANGSPIVAARPSEPRPRVVRDLVVGMADLEISNDPAERLVTYALGSCLGIAVWDPVVKVGGLLHLMLPASTAADPERARTSPFMFVDTGVPLLFRKCYELGAQKARMIVKVAGGCHTGPVNAPDHFEIGKRNILALRKLLWANNVVIEGEDVGGSQISRTMSLDVGTGEVTLKTSAPERRL